LEFYDDLKGLSEGRGSYLISSNAIKPLVHKTKPLGYMLWRFGIVENFK
jgi:hypothetical protein